MPATEQTWRNQKLLHKIFAVSSLVLLISTIWMFAKDHDRQWKSYQSKAREMDVAYGKWDKLRAQLELSGAEQDKLEDELLVAQSTPPDKKLVDQFADAEAKDLQRLKESESDVQSLRNKIGDALAAIENPPDKGWADDDEEIAWRHDNRQQRQELLDELGRVLAQASFREKNLLNQKKMKSSQYDVAKSDVDLAVRDGRPTTELLKKADDVSAELDEVTRQYQQASDHRKNLKKILDQITADERKVNKKIDDSRAKGDQIAKVINEREAYWIEGYWLGKKILEQPIVDAFNSPLKIDNLWTEGLTHNQYNFKPVLRYDRCTTCHQAMEKTKAGSAVDPKYEPAHELTFALSTPTAAEKDEVDEEKQSLHVLYGFMLAGEGILHRNDVTISYVRDESRAAEAALAENEQGMRYLATKLIESSTSAAFDSREELPQFGLQMGDVIVDINGDRIESQDAVRRMLLETIDWGEPINVTVRRGYPNPYIAHPRLDLFVGSTSPHKLQELGCTVCHEGQGSATDFKWASHFPSTLKQRDQWRKKYGWFDNHHWIYPMFPKRFAESSCLKCHHDVAELAPSEQFPDPPAPKLMAGYDTVRRFGCFGCHEIVGYDGPDKRIGPDLRLEPNYSAAGLQLAYVSRQHARKFEARRAKIEELVAKDEANANEEVELAVVKANLAKLAEAAQRGERLGAAPYDDENRHRLQELLKNDQQAFDDYENAKALGEADVDPFEPAFTPEDYNTAGVLKDDEMPGKFRKVGPALRHIGAKLDRTFIDDWIRQPSHFRPSSQMPQFFRQFDHIQAEFTKTEENEEEWNRETERLRDHTAELEDIEIQGIRNYLLEYSQPYELIDGGEETIARARTPGDAARGKVLFEIGGCLACHSNKDFPGHGDLGPDLTGLGSKLPGEHGRLWLYGWIQNPKRYNTRTKMPAVRLKPLPGDETTDPIADVVAYLLGVKSDWKSRYPEDIVDNAPLDELALMHLAKTFSHSTAEKYLKEGIPETLRDTLKGAEVELLRDDASIASGEKLSKQQKLRYVGSKSISKFGCFACHDIPGFETAKPIGTALSDWGRKDPSKLAFLHIGLYAGHEHGGEHSPEGEADGNSADQAYYLHELNQHNRVGFIHQKLKEPRSFDYATLAEKPYNDRLRMPKFPLKEVQREEIITFVLGLVADPPNDQFIYHPSPRQAAINEGRQVLDRFNCAGCHELEREQWKISFPADWASTPATVHGVPIELSEPAPPDTYPFLIPHVSQEQINASNVVSRNGRKTATLRGRLNVKENPKGALDVWAYDRQDENYLPLNELEADKHPFNELAYNLAIYEPTVISGRLYMPTDAIADPAIPVQMIQKRHAPRGGDLARYLVPRVLTITTAANQSKGAQAWGWVPPTLVGEGRKTNPDWLYSFLLDPHPIRPGVMLNMPKFNMSPDDATKLVNYFSAKDNGRYPYQFDQRKRPEHLLAAAERYRDRYEKLPPEKKKLFTGDRFDDAMRIITSRAGCIQCHSIGNFVNQDDPRKRGPNLSEVHLRLQPSYVRRWIAKPSYTLPYTGMPVVINYKPHDPQQDGFFDAGPNMTQVPVYDGNSTEQLDALVDLLMNLDKYNEEKVGIAKLVPKAPVDEAAPANDAAPANNAAPADGAAQVEGDANNGSSPEP